ncbi:MAG: GNAT family N-acetyltransferase [Acidimicrobiales bacterium]|jgi:ribosomal protein S18 acetylase RimI-like enzyme
MREPDDIEIRRMDSADLVAVCEVIGLAFADNPSTLANVHGDRAKARRVMQDAVRVAKFGRTWSYALVAVQGGSIVGVLNAAQWPHCQLGMTEKIKTAPTMVRIMKTALPRAFTMMNKREARDPHEPHWHIGPIGVRPELQGHGVGKALLKTFLTTVDEQGSPAFLETDVDRNVVLYQRFGFSVTSRENIVGVNTRFMWRDTRPSFGRPD